MLMLVMIMEKNNVKFDRIQELRLENELSPKQIADCLEISQAAYCGYEAGERKIPVSIIVKLADFYETSVDYLLNLSDKRAFP